MKLIVNEDEMDVKKGTTAFEVRNKVKKDADVVVYNGFIIKEDVLLQEGDLITLIQRGEIPIIEELEVLLTSRHTPGVHKKIKKASIGIAGLGGLGSNIAVSLARMGIGKLLLVDFDVVEPSNLNRQQYFIRHIGMLKTEALQQLIHEINPFVEVEVINIYLDQTNIEDCFKNMDVIVEAFDNPTSKSTLVNTVLEKMKEKPMVAASGMAGYFSNNSIKTKRITKKFYLIGDGVSAAKPGCGLMAPRVAIAANHQANTVVRILLGEEEV
ncbi:thiamine biosynthesis protein ThiF [Alkaliphilus metalliredigens QYMF]|uniref:Thiamine biosynthesis protein ThiF n=1 Tax=Alkaliphilus metalliredigens (strain QYMF) TaxID=293826 RepID=A6TVU8_ALKMQ|nr:sulfur carrier protein ThiS adenylyltransferase ThiF [Alkaliphilus metalliredigens]ABR50316.1 thiamine biosynthesis protein ThiF [Alkaliphilus metalliredigens QYMF]